MGRIGRHVGGDANVVLVTVTSGVTVVLGDLMFLDNADNLRNDGSSTVNYFAYPLEYFRMSGGSLTLNRAGVTPAFLGVAMDDVDGINNNLNVKIPIATTGKFNFDMKPAKTVYASDMFGASGTTSGSNLFNQKIMKVTDDAFHLGRFAESRQHATKADVFIHTVLA